jgi:hypothetical protein
MRQPEKPRFLPAEKAGAVAKKIACDFFQSTNGSVNLSRK